MVRTTPPTQALQQLPKKWAVAIVCALILYVLLQPVANSRLGWHLPSLASLMGMEKPATKPDAKDSEKQTNKSAKEQEKSVQKPQSGSNKADRREDQDSEGLKDPSLVGRAEIADEQSVIEEQPTEGNSAKAKDTKPQIPKGNTSEKSPEPKKTETTKPPSKADTTLKYGFLKDVGKEVYVSPAGLRYTRGSEEGHRLKHLERHLEDDPDRPGKHGVFDGDMEQALRWIDDAYTRGKQGAKGVRVRDEDGRKVYEVPFSKPIGFIGGRDGRRDKNPEARKLRLVLDGDRVITAFPF